MSTSTNLWRRRRGSRLGGIRTPVLVLSPAVQWVTVYLILALLLLLVAAAVGAERAEARPTCPPGHTYEQEVNGRHISEWCTPVDGSSGPLDPTEAWEKSGPLIPESANLENEPQTPTTVYPARGWCHNTTGGGSRPDRAPSLWCLRLPDDGEREVFLWDERGRWQHVDTVLAGVHRGTNINWYSDPGGRHRPEGTGQSYDIEDKFYRVKVVTRHHGTKFYDVRPGHAPVEVTTTTTRSGRSRRGADHPPPDTTRPSIGGHVCAGVWYPEGTPCPTTTTTTAAPATTTTTAWTPPPPASSDPCVNGDWLTCRATTEPKRDDYPSDEEYERAKRCHWTWCPGE